MAFTFDPRAALARAQNRPRPASTVSIVPTETPPSAETVGAIVIVERPGALAAARAVGSVGTVEGAEAAPDLEGFEERAAIAEHDGGASREEAEWMAAEALGFADPAALYAAAADGWRRNLEALAASLSPDRAADARGQECVANALTFIGDGWAEKAAALGWTELELFGVDRRAPWERLDRLGAAYSPFTPAEVTRDAIRHLEGPRRWRASQADGATLPWMREK